MFRCPLDPKTPNNVNLSHLMWQTKHVWLCLCSVSMYITCICIQKAHDQFACLTLCISVLIDENLQIHVNFAQCPFSGSGPCWRPAELYLSLSPSLSSSARTNWNNMSVVSTTLRGKKREEEELLLRTGPLDLIVHHESRHPTFWPSHSSAELAPLVFEDEGCWYVMVAGLGLFRVKFLCDDTECTFGLTMNQRLPLWCHKWSRLFRNLHMHALVHS